MAYSPQTRLAYIAAVDKPMFYTVETPNPFGLTARQGEILKQLAEGHTNQEIADKLFISVKTVDNHVSAILERLGARTRTEAVTEYLRHAAPEAEK